MSILSTLFNTLTGNDESTTVTERPCSNCPSSCAIAGDACQICEPYKRKLIDQIYYIDHLTEYYDKYEVTGSTIDTEVNCPYCGARSTNPYVCEYCGSKLSEASGKIRVEKASDIPNPIMEAQNIIFERADVVMKYSCQNSSSTDDSLFGSLISFISGSSYTDTQNPLGAKMSESEIKEAASLYNVSVSDYLTGLDNGQYLTLAGKKAESTSSTMEYTSIPGVAGIGISAGAMLGDDGFGYRPRPKDAGPEHRPPANRPPQNMRPHSEHRNERPNDHRSGPQNDHRRSSQNTHHGPEGHDKRRR